MRCYEKFKENFLKEIQDRSSRLLERSFSSFDPIEQMQVMIMSIPSQVWCIKNHFDLTLT